MVMQGDLFGVPPSRAERIQETRLLIDYEEWRQTPGGRVVWELVLNQALAALEQNRRFGIGQLVEHVRWEAAGLGREADGYKVNNNHRAYLIRELLAVLPELEPLVETRNLRSAPPESSN